jgi:hypothetical protein
MEQAVLLNPCLEEEEEEEDNFQSAVGVITLCCSVKIHYVYFFRFMLPRSNSV